MSGTGEQPVGLGDCLELLRGPTDERRFVGLLLVTKLLSSGDLPVIKTVYTAIGSSFINRLLLPLGRRQENASEQAVSTCSLALAMLSSFSRVHELASSQDLLEKIPLLIKVVRSDGITGVLSRAGSQVSAEPSVDSNAVKDSLDCLAGIAASSQEGSVICLESAAIPAACSALQAGSARKDIHQQALAVRLLHTLLESLSHANKSPETPWADVLVPGVPALAQLLVVDTILAQAKGKQPVGQPARSHTGQVDRAALQLEAAYLLLFILENFSPQAEAEIANYARSGLANGQGWLLRARAGLTQLLRARVAPAQRQATLQLCAALSAVGGPHWLLASSRNVGELPETFFQLLVESLKVEALIGLRDALEPDNLVPVPGHASSNPAEAPTQHDSASKADATEDASVKEDDSADFSMLPPLERPKTLVDEEGNDLPSTKRTQHDSSSTQADGITERAGERAARVLPAVFALVETCIEALAVDTARAEAADDAADESDINSMPVFSDSVKGRATTSMQETCDGILQYLEYVQQEEEGASDKLTGMPELPEQPLVLAGTRCMGRLLAEVPDAFSQRVQRLLPLLMTVHGGKGVPFLLPALLQVLDDSDTEGQATWLTALLQNQAKAVYAVYSHARRAAEGAAAAMLEASSGAVHQTGAEELFGAIAAAEQGLLMSCKVLLDIFNAMKRSGDELGQAGLPPSHAADLVQSIACWAEARQGKGASMHKQTTAALMPPDPMLVQAAAGTVAEALNQMKDSNLLGQNSVVAAKCIGWAVDDGYTRSIIARGLALRRAQAQLASSSLSDSIPDLGPNMRPPTGPHADKEEDWLLDSKPLWKQAIASAARLSVHCEQFRKTLRRDPRVKQWLADSKSEDQGQTHVKELSPLLEALTV